MDILNKIQTELNAPRNQYNKFGKYHYRSCEDILEGLKSLLEKYECSVVITDSLEVALDRVYIKATAKLVKDKEVIAEAVGFAREAKVQAGMQDAQLTGSTSSYARKYALNGLFAIDDSKDADTNEHHDNANNNPNNRNGSKPESKKVDPNSVFDKTYANIVDKYLNSDLMTPEQKQTVQEKIRTGEWVQCKNLVDMLIKNHGALN